MTVQDLWGKLSAEERKMCADYLAQIDELETDENLYLVYRDIRREGMIWTDINPSNIGVLKRPNQVYVPSIKGVQRAHPSRVGLGEEPEDFEVLPAGELVLLDLDYDFDENNPEIVLPDGRERIFRRFEDRYQEELRNEQKKKEEVEM